jgi:hypothetical protein
MPSRLAHDEPRPSTSAVFACLRRVLDRPASHRACCMGFRMAAPPACCMPSRSTIDARTCTEPPGQSDPATAFAKSRSPSSTSRSKEPHGSVMRSSWTRRCKATNATDASATMNSAFGSPPLRAGRAARRDGSRKLPASVSTPMTSADGFARAVRRTAAPSPVPSSTMVRA